MSQATGEEEYLTNTTHNFGEWCNTVCGGLTQSEIREGFSEAAALT